ncbi:MAG TPA: MFS transporter [Thermoplasmata archaeon]|nr:MFS transporter [Thermoplasmata archaeon]
MAGASAGANGVPAPAERLDASHARAVLAVLAGAALMVTYVETMVVPAIVRFRVFFDGPPIGTVAWILSAYLLVGVATTPIFGKLGDIYGKKRVLVLVMSVYAAAVTIAGFTPPIGAAFGVSRFDQIYLLIAVRAVQGVGMSMFPLAFAMIGETFPPNRVATAQGIVSAMFAAGATLGLVGGAWITEDFGWQTTYHTVIPVAILLVILTVIVLRESRHRLDRPLDIPGSAFLGLALVFGLMGLSEGPYWGWSNLTGVGIAGIPIGVPQLWVLALVFTVAFLVWEPRSPSPIVDFARLRERNIWISNVIAVLAGAGMFLIFVANSILIQIPVVGLGRSVLDSGLLSVPTSNMMMLLGPVVGRAIPSIGPRPVMILGGLLMAAGGGLLAALTTTNIDLLGVTIPTIVFTTIPALLGVIFCFIAMTNIIVLASGPKEMGIQTGMNATFRTLGQSLGPVVATTILSSFTVVVLVPIATTPTGPVLVATPLPGLTGFQYVYLAAALMGVLTAALSGLLVNYRFHADGTRQDAAAPTPARRPVAEPRPTTARP